MSIYRALWGDPTLAFYADLYILFATFLFLLSAVLFAAAGQPWAVLVQCIIAGVGGFVYGIRVGRSG